VSRFMIGMTAVLALTVPASAHFLYVVPAGDGFQLVFNDGPQPDEKVNANVLQAATFRVYAKSQDSVSTVVKKDGEIPRFSNMGISGASAVGTVPYGVLYRGDVSPVFVVYHSKAIGTPVRPGDVTKPCGQPLELTPVTVGSGIGFLVTEKEKPVAGVDVAVNIPGESKPKMVKTDAAGRTPAFDKPGDYGARVYKLAPTTGEYQGRKYQGERHYATLTMKYEPGK
jgi:hypothetical protein